MLHDSLSNRTLSKTTLLVVAALCVAMTALVVSARSWLTVAAGKADLRVAQAEMAAPSHFSGAAAVTSADQTQKRLDALIIKLRRTGFEPAELTRSQGRFLLAFDNHTGVDEIVLQFKQENGERLREVRMPRGSVRWRQPLDLRPGKYLLSVVGHPEWVCQLTITAH